MQNYDEWEVAHQERLVECRRRVFAFWFFVGLCTALFFGFQAIAYFDGEKYVPAMVALAVLFVTALFCAIVFSDSIQLKKTEEEVEKIRTEGMN